eukprot:121761_1
MSQRIKQLLCELVCNAQSTKDITHLLELIPLEVIQNAILEALRSLDTNTANDIGYKCLSITDVLPDDITQKFLSFSDSLCMKYVNKAFNNCHNKNKALELNRRQQMIDKHPFNPIVVFEPHNKTWVIDPKRSHLSSEEIAKGYKGPLTEFKHILDDVQSGDRLLFYDGHYIETNQEDGHYKLVESSIFIYDDLQLIGMGNDVFIEFSGGDDDEELRLNSGTHLYFKNMRIDSCYQFYINNHSSICMENCEIDFGAIFVGKTGTFTAKRCVFKRPIEIRYGSNVTIVGCTFTHYLRHFACVELTLFAPYTNDDGDYPDTFLKCVSNIFEDNFGYPIALNAIHGLSLNAAQAVKSVLKNNILNGFNGVDASDVVDTANKMYNLE